MKTIKKSTSLILAALLLLGIFTILPLTSSAATISRIEIINLTEPVADQAPDLTADAASDAYEVTHISWYDYSQNRWMTESDVFVEGVEYEANVNIEAADGNEFYSPFSSSIATINGKNAQIGKLEFEEPLRALNIRLKLTAEANQIIDPVEAISLTALNITGVTTPVGGNSISQTADSDTGYIIESVSWWNKTDGFFLLEGDKFADGKTYTVKIRIKAATGYNFDNPAVKVNGAEASATVPDGSKPGEALLISKDFTAGDAPITTAETTEPYGNTITTLDITGVTAPEPGETISRTADSGTGYIIESVSWWNKTDGFFLLEGDKFADGKVYTVKIRIKAVNRYIFADPAVKVNGADASATVPDGCNPGEALLISRDFSFDEPPTEASEEPTETTPVETTEAAPIETATETNPIETTETTPIETPTETTPVEKPTETTPVVKPTETAPVVKPTETTPVVKPTNAQPATSATKAPSKTPIAPAKKPNPLKVSVKSPTVKLKKLKKSAQKVKALNIKNAKGKLSCKIKNAKKIIKPFLKISSKGVITIKKWKAAVKGTYNITVKITANGTKTYSPETIKKTVKIKIK